MNITYIPEPGDIVVFPGAPVKEYRTVRYVITRVGHQVEYHVEDPLPGVESHAATLDRLLEYGMRPAEPATTRKA